jgi:chromosomal replication initiation ATPase DnaA
MINKNKKMIAQRPTISSQVYYIPGIKTINYNEHDLIRDVCEYFKLPVEKIKLKTRERYIVTPRQITMYFLREMFSRQYGLKGIGALLGQPGKPFNHSTVLHSITTVENDMRTSTPYKDMVKEIQDIINGHVLKSSNDLYISDNKKD